ncbi:MAG: fatty acid desaturase [Myxococcota bacterium]
MLVAVASWLVASTLLGLGNTVGYHRLLTHRSFETHWLVRAVWTLLGAMHSGSPLVWVGLHRLHHARSDGEGDPHSPRDGLWHAHCGWLFGSKNPVLCALFAASGFGQQAALLVHDVRRLMGRNPPIWRDGTPDLNKEPLMRALDVPGVMPALFLAQLGLAVALGGLWGVLWLWLLHLTLTNGSWAVNSVGHWTAMGAEAHDNHDTSRNVAWLALFTWGEGYHNSHHRYPRSARHGLGQPFDASWLVIRAMGAVGLAWNVWLPKAHRASVPEALRGKFR